MAKKKSKAKKAKSTKSKTTKIKKTVKKKVVKKTASKKTSKKASIKKVTAKKSPSKKTKSTGAKKSKTKTNVKASKVINQKDKTHASETLVSKPETIKSTSVSAGLKIGQVVPEFHAKSTSGDFKLSNFKGKNIVLYFYPKDNTPGCTLEGHDFSEALSKFSAKNTVVFGISKDSVKTHEGFISKQNYKHHLISDENESVCQIFGVIKEKSMYGRTYLGIDRSTFLIASNGVLKAEWRNVKVNGHVAEVLAKI